MTDREAEMARFLQKIAEANPPMDGSAVRLMARVCLTNLGLDWRKPQKGWGNE